MHVACCILIPDRIYKELNIFGSDDRNKKERCSIDENENLLIRQKEAFRYESALKKESRKSKR